jgi:hypothetical protein
MGVSFQAILPLRPSIRIDATLDLRDPFMVADDHRGDGDCASYKDCADRNQQTAQAKD